MFGFKSGEKNNNAAVQKPRGLFASLKQKLSKTRATLSSGIGDILLGKKAIDDDLRTAGVLLGADDVQESLRVRVVEMRGLLAECLALNPAVSGDMEKVRVWSDVARRMKEEANRE